MDAIERLGTQGTRFAVALLCSAVLTGCAVGFPPYDSGWVDVGAGVAYRRFTPFPYSEVHVVRVELGAGRARLALSAPGQSQRLSGWARDPHVLAAVNASFFDRRLHPLGPTRSGAIDWPDSGPLIAGASIHCNVHGPCALGPDANADIVFSGTPLLLQDGQDASSADCARRLRFCQTPHPRTAFGISADGMTVYLLMAEGRQPPVYGLDITQMSTLMRGLGAVTAVNLDGGGSSGMLVNGQLVSGRPNNEPTLRPVSNALLVLKNP